MTSDAESSRWTAFVFAASFALSALLCVRLAFVDASYWLGAALFVAIALLGTPRVRGRARGPLLSLAILVLLLAVPELGLRSAGFRYVSGIQFGYPTGELYWELDPDPELFWKLPPSEPLANRLGFFGPDPVAPKPAGTWRYLVLGDSCSQQGFPSAWPEHATPALQRATQERVDEVNLALSGYSSHQGRVLAERHGAELEPDLVAVYFGWNDHWLARGATDAEKKVDLRFERLYRRFRILQALQELRVRAGWVQHDAALLERERVPLEDFRANIARIVELFATRKVPVVLITAPTTYAKLGVPDYVVEAHFARSKESALELHRAYVEVVREVARASGAHLLDLAAEMEARDDLAALFYSDGIHPNEAGRVWIGQRFAAFVQASGLAK